MKRLLTVCLMAFTLLTANADVQVKEKLNRAPVAVMTKQGVLVSWRYLSADGAATFSVYRNGTEIATGISTKTNYLDASGKAGDTYKVKSSNGDEATCTAWNNMFTKSRCDLRNRISATCARLQVEIAELTKEQEEKSA